jgi:RND family efflux transporter MFP subunit
MRDKLKSFWVINKKRKRTWVLIVLVFIIACYFIFKTPSGVANTVTDISKVTDLKETVLATGQVVSNTDLSLAFNSAGIVKSLKVKIGDKVVAGQVLATLDSGSEQAALTSARGALAAAQARLKRTIEGASNEEISLSEITLNQTKLTQETLVNNAYQNLLNSYPDAVPKDGTSDYIAPVITGTYRLGKEGKINLSSYYSTGGTSFTITGLTSGVGISNTIIEQPIGDSGLFIRFPNNTSVNVKDWVIEIPNKKASNYLANLNAYQTALSQSKFAIDQRTAELAIKKSTARSSDIDLANADILSAQGQVEGALARYNNTVIIAPVSGTITSIDIKIGEQAIPQKSAIVLQDVSNIYLETNINEANIANLTVEMPVEITYDSFGSDRIFKGIITKIDPSSTLVSGVVNYKVTASTDQLPELRPGMTANMTIKVKEKDGVIAIPSRAIITDDKGNRMIRIITNARTKKYKSVPVVTGIEGDGGMIEVLSGLSVGQEFVILIK